MIKKSRSCEGKKLNEVISLGKLYLSDFTYGNRYPPRYPLDLVFCGDCGLVQLKNTTPRELLYTKRYGYKSGVTKTMNEELENIDENSKKYVNGESRKLLVDIGANDGTLFKYFGRDFMKVGIDPVKKFAKELKGFADIVISDYFNLASFQKAVGSHQADIVTAIACFYDIDNLNDFVREVKSILALDGVFVVQQNYLVGMLEQNAFDNIVHEHITYFSLTALDNLLMRHGLEVFDVEKRNINGGSFRTAIGRKGLRSIEKSVKRMKRYEEKINLKGKGIYNNFSKRVKKNGEKINKFIREEVKKGKRVYLYGASTRGNTLIQYYKLGRDLIKKAVERNPEKWGQKIASLGILIISEEEARKEKPHYMLVAPWHFKDEFLEREKEFLSDGGHFIFPLPEFEVI